VARTDFALLESNLETIAGQIARLPSRAFLCRMLLLATASIWALLVVVFVEDALSGYPSRPSVGSFPVTGHCARS
jgi:hypothetical protein